MPKEGDKTQYVKFNFFYLIGGYLWDKEMGTQLSQLLLLFCWKVSSIYIFNLFVVKWI